MSARERKMGKMLNTLKLSGAAGLAALMAAPALAQDAGPVMDKGDVSWMLVSTILVLFMILPGLALFYGGLVRAKNMLSVLMQITMITAMVMVIWVVYGYSFAFGGGEGAFWGGTAKLFLAGVTADSMAATFSEGYVIPEFVFIAFQMTFAAITPALIVGAFAERIKFSAVLLFTAMWVTVVYFPIAHMVWDANGYLFAKGAIDFAGGTVVHINAGVAGLVGAYMIGKRVGYGREPMPPHNLVHTMVGASLLWVGWFGFNAGSALEAGNFAALAFINTLLATAGAVVAWSLAEWILKGHASMLGAASGAVAGLVAITPAAGNVGLMGALAIGAIAAIVCLWGVTGLKRLLKADDSLDVFGVHGIGGIVGALLTGVFNTQALGGPGLVTDWVTASVGSNPIAVQVLTQAKAVGVTVVWSAVAAFIAFKIADLIVGLRVAEEAEREGLDTNEHNERAYTN